MAPWHGLAVVQALAAATEVVESHLGMSLKKFLKKQIVSKEITDKLAVADSKLGGEAA